MRRFKFFRGDKKKKKEGSYSWSSWWPTPATTTTEPTATAAISTTVVPEYDFDIGLHQNHHNYNPLDEDLQHPVSNSDSSSPSTSPLTASSRLHQHQCNYLHTRPPGKDYKTHFLLRVRLRTQRVPERGLLHPRRPSRHCSFTSSTSAFSAVSYLLIIVLSLLLLPVASATATPTSSSVHSTESFMISPLSPSSSTFTAPTQTSVHFRQSGEPCTLDIECSGSLICAKPPRAKYSYCDCDGRNYTWSDKLQKCVGLVHSICTNSETGDKLSCVDNAYCVIKPELGYGICECTGSYSPTSSRNCQLRFGYPCVNQNYDNLCNKDQMLNCIEDVCRCMFPNQMKYDKEVGQCRMLVGNSCDPKSEVREFQEDRDVYTGRRKTHIGCVSGAKCVARDSAGEYGECQLIEPLNTSTTTITEAPFPSTWFGKKPLRKNPDSKKKEEVRHSRNHHHNKRKESIKNSMTDENQEIPDPEAKPSSSLASLQSSSYVVMIGLSIFVFVNFARSYSCC